jgi:hypothetical protein
VDGGQRQSASGGEHQFRHLAPRVFPMHLQESLQLSMPTLSSFTVGLSSDGYADIRSCGQNPLATLAFF